MQFTAELIEFQGGDSRSGFTAEFIEDAGGELAGFENPFELLGSFEDNSKIFEIPFFEEGWIGQRCGIMAFFPFFTASAPARVISFHKRGYCTPQ